MRARIVAFLGAVMLVSTSLSSWAAPGGGIATTLHDFSVAGPVAGGGVGLCTFCHTPHKATTTLLLWNHKLTTNSFSWDVARTTAGTTFPTFAGDTYKGPTARCLSCHDGSVAVGDIVWWNKQVPATPLDPTLHGAGDPVNVGLAGAMAGNHPVAMPYPYQQAVSTYNGATTGAGFVAAEWQSDPTTLNIRLFNDNAGDIAAGPVAAQTGIECSSCHDPHNKASVDVFFLRGNLTGNDTQYICLKCHIK